MAVDALASIQARIASIQQRFSVAAPAPMLGEASLAAGASDFAALLSDAQSEYTLDASPRTTAVTVGDRTRAFIEEALRQSGDRYVWGASASVSDADPDAFDCSELVKWAAGRVGVTVPDGSWLQYLDLKEKGALIPVEQALRTPGALLFGFDTEPQPGGGRPNNAHVAISLGDGRTIEARGRKYGVGTWEAGDRFQYAGIIPELARA